MNDFTNDHSQGDALDHVELPPEELFNLLSDRAVFGLDFASTGQHVYSVSGLNRAARPGSAHSTQLLRTYGNYVFIFNIFKEFLQPFGLAVISGPKTQQTGAYKNFHFNILYDLLIAGIERNNRRQRHSVAGNGVIALVVGRPLPVNGV